MRSDLLAPLEWGVHRPRPADRKVVVGAGSADFVDMFNHVTGVFRHTIQTRHLVEYAIESAFHGGAVVSNFPDDESIVELSRVLKCV